MSTGSFVVPVSEAAFAVVQGGVTGLSGVVVAGDGGGDWVVGGIVPRLLVVTGC